MKLKIKKNCTKRWRKKIEIRKIRTKVKKTTHDKLGLNDENKNEKWKIYKKAKDKKLGIKITRTKFE
jgi:hypothetical protein